MTASKGLIEAINGPAEIRKTSKKCVVNRRTFLLTSGIATNADRRAAVTDTHGAGQ